MRAQDGRGVPDEELSILNRGLAAMPAEERSYRIDARAPGADQSYSQRQHREAMARNKPPQALNQRADDQLSQWDDAGWDQDPDEAGHRARRLLSRSNLGFHRLPERIGAAPLWLSPARCVKGLSVAFAIF